MPDETNRRPRHVKRILCLANSRKLSGRCLAGREIAAGRIEGWIRPVSDREHEEISEHERQYIDGKDPKLLDVIDVPLIKMKPHGFQRENWLLDPGFYWTRVGGRSWQQLQKFVESAGSLWLNSSSSSNGINDRVAVAQAARLASSLRLIHVDRLLIEVSRPGAAFGNMKRKVQGWFKHEEVQYQLTVTDPVQERRFLAKPDGRHKVGECCLTISLGEPYKGYAYKLIAAVIERAEYDK